MNEDPSHNKDCESDQHIHHLCFLLSESFDQQHPEEFQEVVQDPRFQCHTCGRKSHSEDSLCMPIDL